jgi:hypothetical protein
MKTKVYSLTAIVILLITLGCMGSGTDGTNSETVSSSPNKESLENQAWEMEELYWEYVQKMDTVAYMTLWHNDFIGYPGFGDSVSDKSKIAIWIPELHQDTSLTFSYKLHKKASNAIEDVVIVFYDADEIWTDKENKVVRKETYKLTHTWKKNEADWVILGGMAAKKDQDVLNN